jgi:hypothetical protein
MASTAAEVEAHGGELGTVVVHPGEHRGRHRRRAERGRVGFQRSRRLVVQRIADVEAQVGELGAIASVEVRRYWLVLMLR